MQPTLKHLLKILASIIQYILDAFDCPDDEPPKP